MKKILLVDDEAEIRDVFKEILSDEGYSVIAVENGIKGLEFLEKESFDLILVDKKMPGIDGLDFIREVRGRKIPVKIILITGSIAEHAHPEVDLSISKPCENDHLLEMVKKVLGA